MAVKTDRDRDSKREAIYDTVLPVTQPTERE